MKRIETNEKRLDNLNKVVLDLDIALSKFEESIPDLSKLNKYYESKEWLKDKDDYENGKYQSIKAGVLSEDAIWNLDEDIGDILDRMNNILNSIKKQD